MRHATKKAKTMQPKRNGKKVSFAELDGPFTKGIENGFEISEFVITFFDKNDNEIDTKGFENFESARKSLMNLAAQNVEVSALTCG